MTLHLNGHHPPRHVRADREADDNYAGEGSDFRSTLRYAREHLRRTGRAQRVHDHGVDEECGDRCTRLPDEEAEG